MKTIIIRLFHNAEKLAIGLGFSILLTSCPRDHFSIIIIPDTQEYTKDDLIPFSCSSLFYKQMKSILQMKALGEDIQYVVHMGDITNDNIEIQWFIADSGFKILESARIPYAIVQGNHDIDIRGKHPNEYRNNLYLNRYFPVTRFDTASWFNGGFKVNDSIDNYYCLFEWVDKSVKFAKSYSKINNNKVTINTQGAKVIYKYIILNLEFAPSEQTLKWADTILDRYSDRKAIIITHAYLNEDSSYSNIISDYNLVGDRAVKPLNIYPYYQITTADDFSSAEEIRDSIKKHDNVILVLCGHEFDAYQKKEIGNDSNVFYEVLTDYQKEEFCGGVGWMRELIFYPSKNYILIKPINSNPDLNGNKFTYWKGFPILTPGYPANPDATGPDISSPNGQNNFHTDTLIYPLDYNTPSSFRYKHHRLFERRIVN